MDGGFDLGGRPVRERLSTEQTEGKLTDAEIRIEVPRLNADHPCNLARRSARVPRFHRAGRWHYVLGLVKGGFFPTVYAYRPETRTDRTEAVRRFPLWPFVRRAISREVAPSGVSAIPEVPSPATSQLRFTLVRSWTFKSWSTRQLPVSAMSFAWLSLRKPHSRDISRHVQPNHARSSSNRRPKSVENATSSGSHGAFCASW